MLCKFSADTIDTVTTSPTLARVVTVLFEAIAAVLTVGAVLSKVTLPPELTEVT